jgi:hypothetical protein
MSTKTNERRLNITPGTWSTTQVVYDNYPAVQVFAPFYGEAVHWRKPKAGHTRAERDQQNADAELIADAGATANEVDLLPSELLAKLREAEKTIADLEATCHQMAHTITTFDNPDPA